MYEELIMRLRNHAELEREYNTSGALDDEAADAIEELNLIAESNRRNAKAWADTAEKAVEQIPRWISVQEKLPEESEGLNWNEDMMIRFTSVWSCDVNTGRIAVRNRLQRKKIWVEYLDRHTKDTNWQWSDASWEPTHWMPIVPLPQPPKEET